tara:strand:+ start:320 stop:511 length:192 start_codon:yes stop_codon:yes gene_type:complete
VTTQSLHDENGKNPPSAFDALPMMGSVGAAMNHLMTKKAKQVKAKGATSVWAVTVAWVDELLH